MPQQNYFNYMQKFKKGDIVYIISKNSLIIPCEVLRVTSEDHIDLRTGKFSKKKLYKVDPTWPNRSTFPQKMVNVKYEEHGKEIIRWIELDSVKHTPGEFLNFIPMPWQTSSI